MKIDFILNESISGQEREFIRNTAQDMLAWVKNLVTKNGASELLNLQPQNPKSYHYTLDNKTGVGIAPKQEKLKNINVICRANFVKAPNFDIDTSGLTSVPYKFSNEYVPRIEIIFTIHLNPYYHDSNIERFMLKLSHVNNQIYDVLTHEFEHSRQISKRDNNLYDSGFYFERKVEIEAFAKGLVKSWKKFSVHGPKPITFSSFVKSTARPHLGNMVPMSNTLQKTSKQDVLNFYSAIIDYVKKHFPKIDLSDSQKNYEYLKAGL